MTERCHIEIYLDGGWRTAGELRVDDPARGMHSAASFDYDFDFLDRYAHRLGARDVHAVSCRYGLGYQAYRQESWPAFLLDVVPSGAAATDVGARAPVTQHQRLRLAALASRRRQSHRQFAHS